MPTLTKKPKSTKLDEKAIADLIAKGGEVPAEVKPKAETTKKTKQPKKAQKKVSVQLRLPQPLIDRIDDILDSRVVDVSCHTWFLEDIEAKILAEGKSD